MDQIHLSLFLSLSLFLMFCFLSFHFQTPVPTHCDCHQVRAHETWSKHPHNPTFTHRLTTQRWSLRCLASIHVTSCPSVTPPPFPFLPIWFPHFSLLILHSPLHSSHVLHLPSSCQPLFVPPVCHELFVFFFLLHYNSSCHFPFHWPPSISQSSCTPVFLMFAQTLKLCSSYSSLIKIKLLGWLFPQW